MVCEYDFFKILYRSEARSIARNGHSANICLLSVSGKDGEMLAPVSYTHLHPPRHLQSAHRLRRRGTVHRLRPAGAAGGGGKMVRFPLIAEEITEYPLPESCFLAALKFF